ncbi:recombinase family protein [Chloroflexota bacterium]
MNFANGLTNLIADARRRKFQAVLVWALDRLSREGALAILRLVSKLSSCGVKVLSYQESWTEAPGELAELLYALTGWVARMESQRRSERTKTIFRLPLILGKSYWITLLKQKERRSLSRPSAIMGH